MLNGLGNAMYAARRLLGRKRWSPPFVSLFRGAVRSVRSGWRTSIDAMASRPRTRSAARTVKPTADKLTLEFLYAGRDDRYGLGTREIEAAKYQDAIEVLDGRRHARPLEVGFTAGVFSERLAPLRARGAEPGHPHGVRPRARFPAPYTTLERAVSETTNRSCLERFDKPG